MLRIIPTDHKVAAKLQGDYDDLYALRNSIGNYLEFYQVCADYPDEEYEFLLSLNYDIRHAYMGDRDFVPVDNQLDLLLEATDFIDHSNPVFKKVKGNNLYYSVDIALPLMIYYAWSFKNILDNYYLDSWFNKFNSSDPSYIYDEMAAEHDRSQMHLFNAAVWEYLKNLLGKEDTDVLFTYYMHNDKGTVYPSAYISAILNYYESNAQKLSGDDLKSFIILTAYGIMGPEALHASSRKFASCKEQYQRVKENLKGKLSKSFPTYLRFITLENKYFAGKTEIYEDEFEEFIDKYFGKVDWDHLNW